MYRTYHEQFIGISMTSSLGTMFDKTVSHVEALPVRFLKNTWFDLPDRHHPPKTIGLGTGTIRTNRRNVLIDPASTFTSSFCLTYTHEACRIIARKPSKYVSGG